MTLNLLYKAIGPGMADPLVPIPQGLRLQPPDTMPGLFGTGDPGKCFVYAKPALYPLSSISSPGQVFSGLTSSDMQT